MSIEFPLHSLIMIHPSGLIVYKKSFVQETVDENLFSGFIAAILAFSKELGSELSTIGLQDMLFYFNRFNFLIFVLGLESDIDQDIVKNFFNHLSNSPQFIQLSLDMESRVIFPLQETETDEVDQLMNSILLRFGVQLDGVVSTAEELTFIKDIIEQLRDKKTTPKAVAEGIFGEGLTAKDPEFIQQKIEVLRTFLDSGYVHQSLKEPLIKLIQYLDRTIKSAKIFGF
ncbi:MAG: hypothetical protein ACW991_10165 [Candidatus Hodarchaeales archaeon]